MAAFVRSVEDTGDISITGATEVTFSLTKGQDEANCIPFLTIRADSSVANSDDRMVKCRIFDSSGTPTVGVIRDGAAGTVVARVFVVEMDPNVVTVQQGTWSMTGTNTVTKQAIDTVGDVDKAFVISTYSCDITSDTYGPINYNVKFNSVTEIEFKRSEATTNVATGTWFVVHTTGTDFSVQHDTITFAAADETKEVTLGTTVTANRTFIYATRRGGRADDVDESQAPVDLKDVNTIRARRGYNAWADTPNAANGGYVAEVQTISCASNEFTTEQFDMDWGNTADAAVTVTSIDQTKAIVVSGGQIGEHSSKESNTNLMYTAVSTMRFTSNTEVTGSRTGSGGNDGVTVFHVVEFDLAAVLVEPGIVMAPYISA